MAKLSCRASQLKSDDYKYKTATFYAKSCTLCNLASYENVEHMIMTCPHNQDLRIQMFDALLTSEECVDIWNHVKPNEVFKIILGGKMNGHDFCEMVPIWCNVCIWVSKMYYRTLRDRVGIG